VSSSPAFVDLDGKPLPWLQPLDSLSGNGRHAVVISPELVRIELLHIGRTYELAISKHALASTEAQAEARAKSKTPAKKDAPSRLQANLS
jgi:hypothetical protein